MRVLTLLLATVLSVLCLANGEFSQLRGRGSTYDVEAKAEVSAMS